MCFLSALIFLTSLDVGCAGNFSVNESLIQTGPQSGWCPSECSCILTYHVDCMNVGLEVLRVKMFPANSSRIRSLWLDYTNLTKLKPAVFKNMRYLKRLSLSHNYLTELNPRLFSDLFSLKYLDLRNNCLASPLHNDLFKSLGQLRILKLDYNKLTRLDSKIVTPIANNITELTLSNNPFVCDCNIRDAVEWFKRYDLSSEATCGYPRAGESWKTLTFPGQCEFKGEPQIDLTCHHVSRLPPDDIEESSSAFPLLLVLVVSVCGFLLLLCGGLALYCWRRATRNSTPNLDSRINETKHYDDIRPSDDYYYETVRSFPRYMSVMTSSRPGSAPEIPKRPQISRTELHNSYQSRSNDYVGKVRNSVNDSDSYIQPENPTTKKETPADKLLASGGFLALSEVLKRPGDMPNATGENTLVLREPLQSLRFQTNETDEEKDVISPLPSEAMTPASAVRYDRAETIEFEHVQTQKPEYPWNRESFWKS